HGVPHSFPTRRSSDLASGPPFERLRMHSRGSTFVNRSGKSETASTTRITTVEIQNMGRPRISRQASNQRLDFFSEILTASTEAIDRKSTRLNSSHVSI